MLYTYNSLHTPKGFFIFENYSEYFLFHLRMSYLQLLEQYHTGDAYESAMLQDMLLFIKNNNALCLQRSLSVGHVTTSAWITDYSRAYVLLMHHQKLDKWLQLGGHADGESDLQKSALKEAMEESGLTHIRLLAESIFDVDIHLIPARKQEPAHYHYDVRFLMEADKDHLLVKNHESKALAWVHIDEVLPRNPEESIARMVRKHQSMFNDLIH
jgi:8-oxo-dGTP pyrophosphatase MutT (NUDIX family)